MLAVGNRISAQERFFKKKRKRKRKGEFLRHGIQKFLHKEGYINYGQSRKQNCAAMNMDMCALAFQKSWKMNSDKHLKFTTAKIKAPLFMHWNMFIPVLEWSKSKMHYSFLFHRQAHSRWSTRLKRDSEVPLVKWLTQATKLGYSSAFFIVAALKQCQRKKNTKRRKAKEQLPLPLNTKDGKSLEPGEQNQ